MLHWVANFNANIYPDDWPQRTHIWWIDWEAKTRTTKSLEVGREELARSSRMHPSIRYAIVSRPVYVWEDIESGWDFRNEKGQ